jgi:hypothetical protein
LRKAGFISLGILLVTLFVGEYLRNSPATDPTGVAAPTPEFWIEVDIALVLFSIFVAFMEPIRNLMNKKLPKVANFFQRRAKIPPALRILSVAIALIGIFVFGFWMIADVLGGLNGYGYSFSTHPYLPKIYDTFHLGYITAFMRDIHQSSVGAESTLFFSIALIALILFQLNRGIGTALKDTLTLFAAPCLVAFELALWNFATPDMSWHVATFLSIGGVYDYGYRALSGGQYLVSNWFVLLVAIILIATRLPGLARPSKILWKREPRKVPASSL